MLTYLHILQIAKPQALRLRGERSYLVEWRGAGEGVGEVGASGDHPPLARDLALQGRALLQVTITSYGYKLRLVTSYWLVTSYG